LIQRIPILFFVICVAGIVSIKAQSPRSVYTNLGDKFCRLIKSDATEAGEYFGRCPGTGGYHLLLAEGDLRQNLTVVTPLGKQHSLELWTIVSSAFSSLGQKAEWRVKGQKPIALIVRYNASEDVDHPDNRTSFLVVTKITPAEICVTHKIAPGPRANEEARELADEATNKPCLKAP
jgi:hypothetical protein